jgi:hypothetical protein
MNYLKITLPIIFLFLSSCLEEQKPSLPPITQEGKDILGCLVNGEVFVAQGGFIGGVDDLQANLGNDKLFISGSAYGKDTKVDGNIYIYIYEDFYSRLNETISLDDKTKEVGYYINSTGKEFYTGQDKFYGELNILKIDTINNFIAGTFWFDAVSTDGEIVEIRDGRFDIIFP